MYSATLRANIPDLDAQDVELGPFVGQGLVAEGLARLADALFDRVVEPEAVVAVSADTPCVSLLSFPMLKGGSRFEAELTPHRRSKSPSRRRSCSR